MSVITERLEKLREKMAAADIAGCIITTDDFHMSEYGSPYFRSRAYFSGFNGSAGTLVVLTGGRLEGVPQEAGLWTDGRYFLQAEQQLEGSGIDLYKMNMPGVPTIKQFLKDKLPEGSVFACDGRTLSAREGTDLEMALAELDGELIADFDPAEGIWEDRPLLPHSDIWILEEQYAGVPASVKLEKLREELEFEACQEFYVSRLDEIAWLLNLRADDIPYNPVFLAFMVISNDKATLFVDDSRMSDEVKTYLADLGVDLKPYDDIYSYAENCDSDLALVDPAGINYRLYDALYMGAAGLAEEDSPIMHMKCVKNETEIKNDREIHVDDGIAMVRFMKWLKERMAAGGVDEEGTTLTELSAAKYLDDQRYAIPGILGLSFPTISGYAHHGAIIHYGPTPESDIPLKPEGLLLVDSGGHYLKGTTDITRTFALGPLTDEEKKDFALVLRCWLNLMNARFPEGVWFENLDALAHLPLWEEGLDFRHGTGHGVGYLLNVHEAPNRFYWKPMAGREPTVIRPGMITTDEPGVYIAGKHGIRIENELLCVEDGETEYGKWLRHEALTLCPVDLDCVDTAYLNETEIRWLNEYHARVYEMLSPGLTEEEKTWLAEYTRPIG